MTDTSHTDGHRDSLDDFDIVEWCEAQRNRTTGTTHRWLHECLLDAGAADA